MCKEKMILIVKLLFDDLWWFIRVLFVGVVLLQILYGRSSWTGDMEGCNIFIVSDFCFSAGVKFLNGIGEFVFISIHVLNVKVELAKAENPSGETTQRFGDVY